jgi:DhnA family fructose-bisphosphate aldolase class Ia
MIVGKTLRLRNIVRDDRRTVIVALDHGRSRFIPNLDKPVDIIKKVSRGGADAIILSFGLLRQVYQDIPDGLGLILSIPMKPSYVGLALKMGVHAVKTTFFGDIRDKVSLAPLDDVSLACEEWGIPLLSEIVPIDDEGNYLRESGLVRSAVRIAAERGGDIVKTVYTENFREVVEASPIPVVILGGARMDSDRDILETVRGMTDAGGRGVAFGRNVFQHRDPARLVGAISSIVHDDAGVDEALELL